MPKLLVGAVRLTIVVMRSSSALTQSLPCPLGPRDSKAIVEPGLSVEQMSLWSAARAKTEIANSRTETAGNLIALGWTVVSTVTRLMSRVRSAPVSDSVEPIEHRAFPRLILLVATQCASSGGVYEVKLPARGAGDRLIGVRLVGYFVRRPTLHIETRVRAAENERGHSACWQLRQL
jgi:hypothetical protein